MDLPLWMGSVVGIEREKAGGSVVLVVVDVLKDDEGLEDGFVVGIGREKAGGRLVLVVIDVLEDDKGLGDGFTVVDGLYRIGKEKAGESVFLVVVDVLEDDEGLRDGFAVVDGVHLEEQGTLVCFLGPPPCTRAGLSDGGQTEQRMREGELRGERYGYF
ncbi:hypothetical protein CDL15_Pgr018571 [Punica granatum]|uniref:Uncharacterized protein n=1 Tax=Punica granatum TaxID=22663 RepID=A0A218X0Y6_PUNGR|nr:hypothetical protein CDL15_Pgr018571 [Punica granatum]